MTRARTITAMGITGTISQWASFAGLNRNTLASRLRRGWPLTLALNRHAMRFREQTRMFPHEKLGQKPKKVRQ